jgi:hypothetical protein
MAGSIVRQWRTPEGVALCGAIQRCHNPSNPDYPQYGGRGIVVCPEWRGRGGYARFFESVGPKPSPKHHLATIVEASGYRPGNCVWQETHASETHGHARGGSHTRTYNSWWSMIQRCRNPNEKKFHLYGGRGIKVCDRWLESFENFYADMGVRPVGTSLDRHPDQNGNYEPGNCRWATPAEQGRNTRANRILECDGESMCVVEWAERLGVKPMLILGRLKIGWSVEDALKTPFDTNPRRFLEHNGQTKTVSEWARIAGIPMKTLHTRLSYGWTIERAITTPTRKLRHRKTGQDQPPSHTTQGQSEA